jgi:hypothetical protein
LRPGIDVLLQVEGFPEARYGQLKGTVRSVGRFPIDPFMAVGILGSRELAEELTGSKPTVSVTVALQTDPKTRSGLAWTSVKGPPLPVTAQDRVEVLFHLGDRTPLDVVLGTS